MPFPHPHEAGGTGIDSSGPMPPTPGPKPKGGPAFRIALCLTGILAVLLTQLRLMASTNFTGFDEWLIVQLVSKGIIDVPHGNRPVHLLWLLPASLVPHSLVPYVLLHGFYAFASAGLVFLLVRRLLPAEPIVGLLAALFSLVWGPGDLARLSTIERVGYTAFEFGTLLAVALLVESWRLGNVGLLWLSALVAFLVARSYEAPLPLLVLAPLLLLVSGGGRHASLRRWVLVFDGVLALAAGLVLLPSFLKSDVMAYQLHVLGLDLVPTHIAFRLARQYLYHLAPLVLSEPRELMTPAVPLAVATFSLVLLAFSWAFPSSGRPGRGTLVKAGAAGLAWAGLSYLVLSLTPSGPTALRMQILSAPGIGLFLACLVVALASALPPRAQGAGAAVLGAWIVAVGTGRTVEMQKTWDAVSFYPAQIRMLRGLTGQVRDVKPGTLVVLLDEGGAWRATYGFRHALMYLYEGRAIGYIPGAWDALYPARFTPAGIVIEPWPSLRASWGVRASLSRYDETIVARYTREGQVQVLEQWPSELPKLPDGARYLPLSRVLPGAEPLPEQAILGRAPPSPRG